MKELKELKEKSDKWQKRALKRYMDSFYYWNYLRNKPISYFLNPLPINIAWLFEKINKREKIIFIFKMIIALIVVGFFLPTGMNYICEVGFK